MKIYIASPYTLGDVAINVRNQLEAANEIMNLGHTPHVPLLSHFQHLVYPRPYQDWLMNDLEWLPVCDAVLRLPGESKGADIETEYATGLGIPVYYSMDKLKNILKNT